MPQAAVPQAAVPQAQAPQAQAPQAQAPQAQAPQAQAPKAQAPELLAAGHLHPGMLFLRLVDGVRGVMVPAVLALVTQQVWIAVATVILFLLGMLVGVVRFVTFRYRLTSEELVTTAGVLHRQERRIPVDRIQDLSIEQSLLRRVLGLAVVSVETASGSGSEAKLDSLSRHQAELLRAALYSVRADRTGMRAAPGAGGEESEVELHRTTAAELALLGLTNNRLGAILLAVLGLFQLGIDLGMERVLGDAFGGVAGRLSRFGPIAVAVAVATVLFLALIAGWVVSIVASFLMFHDFRLGLRGDVLQRRYGLLTTRARTLPRRRIQRVLLEQTFTRRLLDMVTVRADSAGASMDPRAEERGGLDVVVPLAPMPHALAVVPWLLPGFEEEELLWRRVSPRMVMRVFVKAVLLTVVLVAATWPLFGSTALSFTGLLPVGWGVGRLAYRNMGWALLPRHVAMRWGVLGRYRALIPLRKVQGAVLTANPLDRRLGLARLTVFVAGGSPTTVRNLVHRDARAIMLEVVRRAARTRAGNGTGIGAGTGA